MFKILLNNYFIKGMDKVPYHSFMNSSAILSIPGLVIHLFFNDSMYPHTLVAHVSNLNQDLSRPITCFSLHFI